MLAWLMVFAVLVLLTWALARWTLRMERSHRDRHRR